MSKIVTEINKLNKAVNSFQEEMKSTLALKTAQGKTGWNEFDSGKILNLILDKYEEMKNVQYESQQRKDEGIVFKDEYKLQLSIDMANLSMFYRIALQEGR